MKYDVELMITQSAQVTVECDEGNLDRAVAEAWEKYYAGAIPDDEWYTNETNAVVVGVHND